MKIRNPRSLHARSVRGAYHPSRQCARGAAAPRAEAGNTPPVHDQPAGPRMVCLRRVPLAEFAGSCRLLIAGAFVTMACVRCTNGFTNCCGETCVTVARRPRGAEEEERPMIAPGSPTVRRRRLAAELRGIREDKGKSGDAVAAALKWSPSKISR